jgi:hypothetical protein
MNTKWLAKAALAGLLAALAAASLRAEDSESPPGRGAKGKCIGAGITFDLEKAVAAGGDLTAGGSWKVDGTADGVFLEVRVNSNRYHAEQQQGTAGHYTYQTDFSRCGLEVVRVFASPTVRDGGREIQCLARGHSVFKKIDIDCTPTARILNCSWDCADDPAQGCAGTCTADAKGGDRSLIGLWGVNDTDFESVGGPPFGPWTAVVRCKPGERVTFRARDDGGSGHFSAPAEIACGAR